MSGKKILRPKCFLRNFLIFLVCFHSLKYLEIWILHKFCAAMQIQLSFSKHCLLQWILSISMSNAYEILWAVMMIILIIILFNAFISIFLVDVLVVPSNYHLFYDNCWLLYWIINQFSTFSSLRKKKSKRLNHNYRSQWMRSLNRHLIRNKLSRLNIVAKKIEDRARCYIE